MSNLVRITVLILLASALPGLVLAETVYVNDTLRVGVRSEPNSSVAPHGVVITGMRLQVLEHADGYIKIRDDKGVEGWIKSTYVTPDKPAKLQLAAAEAAQHKLQLQLASQDKQLKDDEAGAKVMTQELQKLKAANSELQAQLARTRRDKAGSAEFEYATYIIVVLLLGVGGFVAGALWHRKQAMQRLAGLRV